MKYITFLDNIWSGDGGHYNYVSTHSNSCLPSIFSTLSLTLLPTVLALGRA